MKHLFQNNINDRDQFVVTVELVPGSDYSGKKLDTVLQIASDALADGRISAVSITDNPGGNPSLSPDVIGREILELGMDVIVHFTCRDMNRGGIESRALQLARLGMKNILALTGDYSGKGFGGQSAPTFDIDSTTLLCFLNTLGERKLATSIDAEVFFTGCAVSSFKATEAETYLQYYKLCKKAGAGAGFIVTQVGFDARKFQELIQMQNSLGLKLPSLGSIFFLNPRVAKAMHSGRVPGTVVTDNLYNTVVKEWSDKTRGYEASVDRCAKLATILKGLGYRGIHIGGIHDDFKTVRQILDRIELYKNDWRKFLPEFDFPQNGGFYVFQPSSFSPLSGDTPNPVNERASLSEQLAHNVFRKSHELFFSFDTPFSSMCRRLSKALDTPRRQALLLRLFEDPLKKLSLNCLRCGDCGIQHLAFLCPESQCPKHIRNGQCGGSTGGMCEVHPDRECVWVRAYKRLACKKRSDELAREFVPPRMWELNDTSSWINFHLGRDHQTISCSIAHSCGANNKCLHFSAFPADTTTKREET